MPRNRPERRRTAGFSDWIPDRGTMLRTVFLLVAGGFAFALTLRVTAAEVFTGSRPATALRWLPVHANASAGMAGPLLAAERTADAQMLARAALQRSPTAVAAVRTLGLGAEAEGRRSEAGELMSLANRLSRRDRPTQVWLLRRAIERSDFRAAVSAFDIAMRTSTRSSAQLTPLLMAATADPRMLPPLRAALVRAPIWRLPFLRALVASGPRLDHIVILARGLLSPAVPEESAVIDALLYRLTSANQFDLAWRIYEEAKAGQTTQAPVRNAGFEGDDPRPPFDWRYAEEPDLAALRQTRPDQGTGTALALIAQNGRSGEVAHQIVRLAPGVYRFQAEMGNVPADPLDRPVLAVSCAVGGESFATIRPAEAGAQAQRISGQFAVPSSCRWQRLTISARSAPDTSAQSPWIDNLTIRPAA